MLWYRSILFAGLASAQINYYSWAEAGFYGLQQWYDEGDGLWDTTGWWNAANALTAVADLAIADGNVVSTATSIFAHTFTAAPAANPQALIHKVSRENFVETTYGKTGSTKRGATRQPRMRSPSRHQSRTSLTERQDSVGQWLDAYYDDNGWWALAWIAAYDRTGNEDYLNTAAGIFNQNITRASPSPCGNGGIPWSANDPYVNAIANELYLSVAAHLANRIPGDSTYLQVAQDQWTWFQNSGMINSQNTINDGLTSSCTNNGETVWSYNQGVILGALVELNKAAPDASLLDRANQIATAAISALEDSNQIIHDPCEPNCGGDGSQFKGVFLRNLQILNAASPSDHYKSVILANAASIWNNDRNSANQFSIDWAGPVSYGVNASTTSSALDCLIAAIGANNG